MDKKIKITFQNITKEFPKHTTLVEISKEYQNHFNFPILVGQVDNTIFGLADTVDRNSEVKFFDRSSTLGNSVYAKSTTFMLILAAKRLFGDEVDIMVEHSIDKGIYCELIGIEVSKKTITALETEMRKIKIENLKFQKISVERIDAIEYFQKYNRQDKVQALKYISNNFIKLYRLANMYDYFYSELAFSTKDIDEFKLTYIKDNGFVLTHPTIEVPEMTLDYTHQAKIFDKFLDYTKWGQTVGISNASELNKIVSDGKYNEIIQLSEAQYNSQLASTAEQIKSQSPDIKIVLIAGPSSSGKTTTSRKLAVYLRSVGLTPHQISLDNYFHPLHKTPVDQYGDYNFESIRALDLNLFNKHLTRLIDGEKVELPTYNFLTGKREFNKNYLQITKGDILIIEGIHGLNEQLTISIDRKNKFKIYISPLTQLNIDNHNRIHTSDTRRLRRIIRDNRVRGYKASETLSRWKKIRAGEDKYIYPFQNEADAIINSALTYELGILKVYAEPLLFSVEETDKNYPEAIRLINFLRSLLPIPSDEVPKDSVLREFIGGSYYHE